MTSSKRYIPSNQEIEKFVFYLRFSLYTYVRLTQDALPATTQNLTYSTPEGPFRNSYIITHIKNNKNYGSVEDETRTTLLLFVS